MKKSILFSSFLFIATLSSMAVDADWLTDQGKAMEKARAEKKIVLMDFTGSDWCGWCIKLDKEVFSQGAFKSYAKQNLVLLKVDFPRKTTLPPEVKSQNDALLNQCGVRGFPTVIVLDSEGQKLGQLGYQPGGPSAFIAALKKLTPTKN